jgi:predicted protein tyrosine phosphatase
MEFFVYSRLALEAAEPQEVPHIIISISSAPDDLARLRPGASCRGVLRLAFADADIASEHVTKDRLFTKEQATRIWQFVEEHRAQIQRIVVHCDAGRSRSPGVAAALSRILNGDDREYFGGRTCGYIAICSIRCPTP